MGGCTMITCLVFVLTIATSAASQGRILILNDLHFDPTFYTSQESCVEAIPAEDMGNVKYGTYDCEPNWELLRSAVTALANTGPTVVIWLGDNTHHARNYTNSVFQNPDFVVDVIANITQLLNETFPTVPVLPVLGNHDYFPKDQLPAESNPTYTALSDIWAKWIGSPDMVDNFNRSGYYSRNLTDGLRAIVLNTNLNTKKDKATSGMADPGGQFAWAQDQFEAAKDAQQKVLFIIHVPVGFDENRRSYPFMRTQDNDRLVDIIRQYNDTILGVFAGHAHTDTFKMVYGTDGTPLSTVFVSPALSPWRSFWGFGARNPAFREVIYSLEYGKLTLENVIQYYLDLPEANKDPNKAAEWKVEYSFRSAYGVRDVSPARTHTLLQQMKEYASDQFHKYHKYNHVSVGVGEYEPCGCQCKAWHLCAIGEVQRKPYERCVDEETTAQCAGASVLASVALVLAATVLQWM